jgi:hypothetical protein
VAQKLVDHASGNAGVFQPGREGVAQVMGTMGIGGRKVLAGTGDRTLVDAVEVVPRQHRPRAGGDAVAAAWAGEDKDLRVGVGRELPAAFLPEASGRLSRRREGGGGRSRPG